MSRLSLALILLWGLPGPGTFAAGLKGEKHGVDGATAIREININRVKLDLDDRGGLPTRYVNWGAYHAVPSGLQTSYYPIVYDQGPWIIGKLNGVPSAGVAHWGTSYTPGPIIDGMPGLQARPQDSSRYHPYKLSSIFPPVNSDGSNWPADLGAPITVDGRPLLLGDELLWSVFNDADSSGHPVGGTYFTSFPHLPVEIQQSVYAWRSGAGDTSLLANTIFIEWTFINKGTAVIESCYTALWTDIDFDDMEHNFPAVDTSAQIGYCWDGSPVPLELPYAVGYALLYGPAVPDPGSTALVRGRKKTGYRNLPLSSFWGIIYDSGPESFLSSPTTVGEGWNLARGRDIAGNVIVDSVTRTPTRFPYSGDPVIGTGWIYNRPSLKGEEGFMMFTGPFTFAPGDTQWMMTALVPALGEDRFKSITTLRNAAVRLRSMPYDSLARPRALILPALPSHPALSQNFPNPFNPETTIQYSIPAPTPVSIILYNVLGQKVRSLVQSFQETGFYEIRVDGSGLASGVYIYRLTAGATQITKKLIVLR